MKALGCSLIISVDCGITAIEEVEFAKTLGVDMITYRNLILTFLIGGLWHGANWTFVIWGAFLPISLAAAGKFCKRHG